VFPRIIIIIKGYPHTAVANSFTTTTITQPFEI